MKNLIDIFDAQFTALNERSIDFVKMIPPGMLFYKPAGAVEFYAPFSCGEFILRSAGAVEQTFGGITAKLWDDPFEWTLPEELSTNEKILEYLAEVENRRKTGFLYFASDEDLQKKIPAPEQLKPIAELLLETLARAEHFQGRAFAVFHLLSGKKPLR